LADVASVRRVVLTGLDEPELVALVTELSAAPPPALASALLRHTGGSPLFVRSLLREYDVDQLAALEARGALPAPSDLAEQLQESLDRLDPRAASLLRALAVLGGDWSELATVAAVAGVEASSDALTTLVRGGLVNVDRRAALPRVKIFHAVVSAAVFDRLPDEVRRRPPRAAAAPPGAAGGRESAV